MGGWIIPKKIKLVEYLDSCELYFDIIIDLV